MGAQRAKVGVLCVIALLAGFLSAGPAQAAPLAEISGIVTAPGGGLPDTPVRVVMSTTDWDNPVTTQTTLTDPTTGLYSFSAPAGQYYLRFEYLGSANIMPRIWFNGSTFTAFTNARVTLVTGSPLVVNRELIPGAMITGTAVGAGGVPLESLVVSGDNGLVVGRSSFDPATGIYVLDRLPPGASDFYFTPNERWQRGQLSSASLTVGQVLTGQDIVLAAKTTIEGRLYYRDVPAGTYPPNGVVYLWDTTTRQIALVDYAFIEVDGSFGFYDVPPGTYQVCAFAQGTFIANCWGDNPTPNATPVTVAAGQVVSGIDIASDPVGRIQGRILARLSSSATASPLAEGRVSAYRLVGDSYVLVASATVESSDGTYNLIQVPPGEYRLRFSDDDRRFQGEYWDDELYFGQALDVTVSAGQTVNLADVTLDTRNLSVSRITGGDRFDVGVNVSQTLFPPGQVPVGGVPVVYVANGYNFPDALTAGPAASLYGGVVLLVEPTAIPRSVATELRRLNPQRIVVAGGPASVSPTVFEQLTSFVASPTDVFRAGGIDRYDASRTVVRDAFGSAGATIAIIATGANFPDALSAGPAAASQSSPVILVDGSASSIDGATRGLLIELGVSRVYIAGGTGSVSPGIESSLVSLFGESNVTRFAGIDRFEVGVLISQEFFASADFSFVATGYKFPDALTGGPLAGAYGAPLFLSEPGCLPPAVAFDILDLDAHAIWLLGGPGSLSPAVEDLQLC